MRAVTVEPLQPETARLDDIPEPDAHDGSVLVEAIAVGVCGTDVEIVAREVRVGAAPARPAWCSVTSRWAGSSNRGGAARYGRGTASWALSGVRTRCPASIAGSANGTCAATARTPSAASCRLTASSPTAGPSSPPSR